jgi:hypothetical protein
MKQIIIKIGCIINRDRRYRGRTRWTQNNGEIENLETGDECVGDTRTKKRRGGGETS